MTNFWKCASLAAVIVMAARASAVAADWTEPVDVLFEDQKCVSYRARLSGDLLIVEAAVHRPWHTFAMDNVQRAAESLAGRRSLGIDLPTTIRIGGGLEDLGPWRQSPPKDFSNPAMRWYSWGYDERALFVTRVRQTGPDPALISIRGQACTESVCRNIDVSLSLPTRDSAAGAPLDIDLTPLLPLH